MANRTALFLTTAALLTAATPALAQDNRYGNYPAAEEIEWQQHEVVQDLPGYETTYETADDYEADAPVRRRSIDRRRHSSQVYPSQYQQSAPRLAYSNEEREAWLADCRIVMRDDDYYDRYDDARYDDEDDGNGGFLGGLFGAVAGGIAGNRIAGRGDRLAGTLIGAGVGGVAGAVIGDALDDDDDRRDYRDDDYRDSAYRNADDYCGAYLRRYEASGQAGSGQMVYVQPVTMVAAPAQRGAMREIIREEWVDVADEPVETRTRRSIAPRRVAREQGKLTDVN